MSKATSVEIVLVVPSLEETAAWYQRVLGWSGHFDVFDTDGKANFGSVNGGGSSEDFKGFNLIRYTGDIRDYHSGQRHFNAHVYVDNVDALYRQVVESGWKPDTGLEDQFWGGRTFRLTDLNGFHITFAQMVEQVELDEVRERYEQIRD